VEFGTRIMGDPESDRAKHMQQLVLKLPGLVAVSDCSRTIPTVRWLTPKWTCKLISQFELGGMLA